MGKASEVGLEPGQRAIWCSLLKVGVAGKLLVVVEVPAWVPDRPYRTDRIFYHRNGTVCREASRAELVRMLQSQHAYYDETPVTGATREGIDSEAAAAFLRDVHHVGTATQVYNYLRALKCVDADDTPTVAGVLLFGRDPQRWLPDARISAMRFATDSPSNELAGRRELTGTLLAQIKDAVVFLHVHMPAPSKVEGADDHRLALAELGTTAGSGVPAWSSLQARRRGRIPTPTPVARRAGRIATARCSGGRIGSI